MDLRVLEGFPKTGGTVSADPDFLVRTRGYRRSFRRLAEEFKIYIVTRAVVGTGLLGRELVVREVSSLWRDGFPQTRLDVIAEFGGSAAPFLRKVADHLSNWEEENFARGGWEQLAGVIRGLAPVVPLGQQGEVSEERRPAQPMRRPRPSQQ